MGSCAAPSAKGDDKFITTDYLQQCRTQHVEIVFDRGQDLFFGPVFADANDAKPEPRQRRNDGRLATGEAVSSERALLGKLLAEGHTGDGLGIAIGAGLRITYQEVAGLAVAVARQEFRAAQLHELIDGSLHGGGASKLGELRHRVLPYCHGVPGTAEPRDYE